MVIESLPDETVTPLVRPPVIPQRREVELVPGIRPLLSNLDLDLRRRILNVKAASRRLNVSRHVAFSSRLRISILTAHMSLDRRTPMTINVDLAGLGHKTSKNGLSRTFNNN